MAQDTTALREHGSGAPAHRTSANGTIFAFSAEDALAAFRAAPNVNSAIKNFLKRQTQPDPHGTRFVKDLKAALASSRDESALSFIEKNLSRFSPHLLAVGAYAFNELVESISTEIVETHADQFNETYEADEHARETSPAIKVKDEAAFARIMKVAVGEVEAALAQQSNSSPFLRAIVLNSIFEQSVLEAGYDRGLV